MVGLGYVVGYLNILVLFFLKLVNLLDLNLCIGLWSVYDYLFFLLWKEVDFVLCIGWFVEGSKYDWLR